MYSYNGSKLLLGREYDEGTRAVAVRSFNLAVALNNGDVFRGDGNVNFLLARADTTRAWRLLRWRDESEL